MIPWEQTDTDFGLVEGEQKMDYTEIFEGINPTIRKTAYYLYGLIGLTIGAIQVGYSAAELGQPTWLTVALAVFGFIGAAFGITAGQNTPKKTRTSLEFAGIDEIAEVDEGDESVFEDQNSEQELLEIPEHEATITRPPSDLGVDEDDIETSGAHAAEVD